ncbi:MAG TPA: cell cycle transcriptional regulator TrcR [Alphaproteobacteria bacterium]|nr:cell cycle transcriptional regulator TrcR [Alphaproteobacteria bacterium]
MVAPLMPKATAVWLIENTALSFDQIADFCQLHTLEVQAIADEEVAVGIVGIDPTTNGQLTKEEIARCEQDSSARLVMAEATMPRPAPKTKGPRYTPIAKRQERPDAIAWLLRHYPELSDAQISRLVGTTKTTINAVRDRTHWKGANIAPVDPVDIGICTYEELLSEVQTARKRKARAEARAAKEAAKQEREAAKAEADAAAQPEPAGAGGAINPYHEHLPMSAPEPGPVSEPASDESEDRTDTASPSPTPPDGGEAETGDTPDTQTEDDSQDRSEGTERQSGTPGA